MAVADNSLSNICLVSPPTSSEYRKAESLGLRYIASCLSEKGVSFELLDAYAWGWGMEKLHKCVEECECNIFGIQIVFDEQIDGAFEVINYISSLNHSATIVIGGHLPTLAPKYFLEINHLIDAVFIGEAEESLPTFVLNYSMSGNLQYALQNTPSVAFRLPSKNIEFTKTSHMDNLDSISFPFRDARDYEKYNLVSVLTSRGCLYSCSFCSVPTFNVAVSGICYRERSTLNIAEELQYLHKELGITNISFLDDIFLTKSLHSKRRCTELIQEIIRRRIKINFSIECRSDAVDEEVLGLLKQVGLRRIFLGVESATETGLNYYNKTLIPSDHLKAFSILDELKIPVCIGFILFNPISDICDIKNNLEFLASNGRLRPRHIKSKMAIYPGSPISEKFAHSLEKSPYKLAYKFQTEQVQYLYSRLCELAERIEEVEIALNHAEFKIGQMIDDKYNLSFTKYRSIEYMFSGLIAETLYLSKPIDQWLQTLKKTEFQLNKFRQIIEACNKI